MDIKNSAVSIKNSVESKKISLPFDSWKSIIEYLHDEDSEDGFGSILPYCAIDKSFSKLILECITKVKITIDHSPYSYSLLKWQKVNDIICRCKGLCSLYISVRGANSFCNSSHYDIGHDGIIEGLQQIGNNCENIEELFLQAEFRQQVSNSLPIFPNLRKLVLENFNILPPSNMQDLTNFQVFEGDLSEHLWVHAISTLPNLKELNWSSDSISNQDVKDFCNQSKENSIRETLQILGLSSSDFQNDELADEGLCLLLDTFPNMRAIKIHGSDISLAAANIPQKLGNLTLLKMLKFNYTHVFSAGYIESMNIDSKYELLENLLQYLPKSLEVVEILNCKASSEYNANNVLDSLKSKIESRFYDVLPNLREMSVTFDIDYDDDYDYEGIEHHNYVVDII
jgi:hypothetical protein